MQTLAFTEREILANTRSIAFPELIMYSKIGLGQGCHVNRRIIMEKLKISLRKLKIWLIVYKKG